MEDDGNHVVKMTEVEQEETEDRPLMSLFRRLISSDNKQNTVVTNAHIKEILKGEFDIETGKLHELEEDIYLNVLKKFLKDWPQWDEFDHKMMNFKSKGDLTGLNTVLQINYKSLKKYLGLMLSIAQPLAHESIKKAESTETRNPKRNSLDDVVLEVHCTRAQLNKLLLRQPNHNGTVFNIDDQGPSMISLAKPTIAGILNSFGISIGLSVNSATITRFSCHEINHILINKKLNISRMKHTIPNERLEMSSLSRPVEVEKKSILDSLATAYNMFKLQNFSEAITVLEILMMDIAEGPEIFRVPARYRKYMSKFSYKRCLNADITDKTEPSEKYDLQLEETISPRYQYTIHKYGTSKDKMYSLQIECTQCNIKFKGFNMLHDLEQHYLGYHSQEPDVMCTNCTKSFSIVYLTDNRWRHTC